MHVHIQTTQRSNVYYNQNHLDPKCLGMTGIHLSLASRASQVQRESASWL